MPGQFLWGWDPVNEIWIPIAVDASGNLLVDMSQFNFVDLADTPGSYSGQRELVPQVNADEDALEFVSGWRWSDRWASEKSIFIPLSGTEQWTRYGVVIDHGSYYALQHPSGVYRDDTLYLYIAEGDAGTNYCDIALYKSTDFETFTRYGTVLSRGGSGAWDERTVWTPKVIYDQYETDSAKKWKMWYNGRDTSNVDNCGLAYSSDGETWTKYGTNPLTVTSYAGFSLAVTRLGRQYYGWNLVAAGLDMHTSNDGITWTRYGRVLNLGSAGQWDDYFVAYPFDFWLMGIHYLLYCGRQNTTGLPIKLGIALSSDGFHGTDGGSTYYKFPFNPVARSPLSANLINCPSVIPLDGKFYCYLQERQAGTADDIALYTLP